MKTNKQWHEANRMPKNPTLEQRYQWHLQHQEACACRPVPEKLREQMRARSASK